MTVLSINEAGWLQPVEIERSPNYDARPENSKIKLVVVHGISLPPGEFGGGYIQQFFSNRLDPGAHEYFAEINEMRVSAHCLIERSGQIIQFVSFHDCAWHAGESNWQGEEACNQFSIGIELEGTDDLAYSDEQYSRLAELIDCLRKHFPEISEDAICGHNDIAPGRKTDPGPAFDWNRLRDVMAE